MSISMSEIKNLSIDERLALVEEIWDSIAAESGSVPMPDWHKEELDRRLEEYERNPVAGVSWEVAKARITGRR